MTKRQFYCNFCQREIDSQRANGYGVYWELNTRLIERQLHDTENHICTTCLNAIKNLDVKVKK